MYILIYIIQYILILFLYKIKIFLNVVWLLTKNKSIIVHNTTKNEGWGFKEDQIPSSSHFLHQTMGSSLIYTSEKYPPNTQN